MIQVPIMSDPEKVRLFNRGVKLVKRFCKLNTISTPEIVAGAKEDWMFSPCAYYRENTIFICIDKCSKVAAEDTGSPRNWNWPGSTTDRTPYGVLAHELGHHVDVMLSDVVGPYTGNYSREVKLMTGEKPITSYAPSDGEWFAEIFRLFVTNSNLLKKLRPKAYACILECLDPVRKGNWLYTLGKDVPPRIIRTLKNKIAKVK